MCESRFYICEHCGNLIEMVRDSGVPVMCCGQKMTELKAGTTEASHEKHIPAVTVEGNIVRVQVGSVAHPMLEEHSILWVHLQTDKGVYRKCLEVGKVPAAAFVLLAGEKPLAAYAYCNLHGLWKADIDMEEAKACDLKPADTKSNVNYEVCKCNGVSYFDILDEINKHSDINALLDVFEEVKDTTHCATGCGGCYDKVLTIISDAVSDK